MNYQNWLTNQNQKDECSNSRIENKQENLFKKFYQVSQGHTREHGGVGLGISICKGIVEGLGGKIWVESNPNKGSVFYFEIPKIREGEKRKNENFRN